MSLPITSKAIWFITSGITGLTLPGMMLEGRRTTSVYPGSEGLQPLDCLGVAAGGHGPLDVVQAAEHRRPQAAARVLEGRGGQGGDCPLEPLHVLSVRYPVVVAVRVQGIGAEVHLL